VKVKVKVKVYAGSHQRALRKGSQLVLTLARAPPKTRKKRNTTEINEDPAGFSLAIRPASSFPEASRSTSTHPIRSPIITVVVKVYFVSCFCNLVQAF
jgi:hypothetical protein